MECNPRDLLTLSTIPGVGPSRLRALVSHFKDTHLISTATLRDLSSVEGIDRKTSQSIISFYRNSGIENARRFIDDQFTRLNRNGVRIVSWWDKEFPENLKKIYDPPPYLFVKGPLLMEDKYSVAIVGTRTPSQYGSMMAERFARGLGEFGIPIVSGLARGIDTLAHQATLKVQGRTVAVLGSGVDTIYPPENRELSAQITKNGALISEFVMGTKPDAGNFPRRNRIISGISLATIVIETGIEGGAMITATMALDQNREVFAIPSAVTDKKRSGTNKLIKEGKALLVESVDDILEQLGPRLKYILKEYSQAPASPPPPLTLFEQQLFGAMPEDPIHIDALAERAGIPISEALVTLLSLEFKGIVRQIPGKMFVKID